MAGALGSGSSTTRISPEQQEFEQRLDLVKLVAIENAEMFVHRNEQADGVVAVDVRLPYSDTSEARQYTFFYYEVPGNPIENFINVNVTSAKPVVPMVLELAPEFEELPQLAQINKKGPRPIGWVYQVVNVAGLTRIPYSYTISGHPSRWARITVVVGHFADVHLPDTGFSQYLTSSEYITSSFPGADRVEIGGSLGVAKLPPLCEVVRLWDANGLPSFGSMIDFQSYFQPFDYVTTSGGYKLRSTLQPSGQTVRIIRGSGGDETIEAQMSVTIPINKYFRRFSLTVETEVFAQNPFFNHTAVYLMHTMGDTELEQYIKSSGFRGWGAFFSSWNHFRYASGHAVPNSGEKPEVEWQDLKQAPVGVEQILYDYMTFVTDLAVGFIPGLGEFVDWSDFALMMSTGEDKWGKSVGTFEKVLMGIGVLLPFVGGSVLRRTVTGGASAAYEVWRKTAPRFMQGNPNTELEAIERLLEMQDGEFYLQAIAEMDLSALEFHQYLKHAEAIRDGSYYSSKWRGGALGGTARAVLKIAGTFFESAKSIRDVSTPQALITGAGDGFHDSVIQAAYRKTGGSYSPMEWLPRYYNVEPVRSRLAGLFGEFEPSAFRKLYFPDSVGEFLSVLGTRKSAATPWGHSWPDSLGSALQDIDWKPPMPINMPTLNGHHLEWNTIRERAWQNYAYYQLLRKFNLDPGQGFDEVVDVLKRLPDEQLDETIPDLKIGRELRAGQLLDILDTKKAPTLEPLNLSKINLTRRQTAYLIGSRIVSPTGDISDHQLITAWKAIGVLELRMSSQVKDIFKRQGLEVNTANLTQACGLAREGATGSAGINAVAQELNARANTYLGGRGRMRYTTFGELYGTVADGADIPIRSVLEIDHNVRQEAHRLTKLLIGNDTEAARITGLGDPFNLEAVSQGEHMLQDAHRIAFSSMFSADLKKAAREMEDQFLRPFANIPDNKLQEIITQLQDQMVDGKTKLPVRLSQVAPFSSEGRKIRRGLWQVNSEILLRGFTQPLFPSIGI